MKLRSIKFLFAIITIVALSACVNGSLQGEKHEFQTTYPSQFIIGDTYILKNHEEIDGNIVGIGTTLIIEQGALVMGDVNLIGSNLNITGRIAGDLNVLAGTSLIKDSAIIAGDINQIFQKTDIAPKALITGEINTYSFPNAAKGNIGENLSGFMEWFRPATIIGFQVGRVLGLVLLALISIYLLKSPTIRIASAIKGNSPAAWGAGLITIIAVPIVASILIITICLSPVGLLLVIALLISSLWGWVAFSSIVGERIVKWLKLEWKTEPYTIFGAFIIGFISILFSLIPCVGFLLNLMITATGIGGVLLSRFGRIEG